MERTSWRRINLSESVSNEADAYDPEDDVALGGYTGSLLAYGLAVAALVTAGGATGRSLPERYRVTDVVLGGMATYKFTRLLSKASVTSPLRAPFTTFEGAAGSAEHHEQARGEGARHTVGELLTCPFCLGQWVGTGYVAALVLAPRSARTWAALFSVTAISDGLQHAYARLRTG
jgi:hypothetical protein